MGCLLASLMVFSGPNSAFAWWWTPKPAVETNERQPRWEVTSHWGSSEIQNLDAQLMISDVLDALEAEGADYYTRQDYLDAVGYYSQYLKNGGSWFWFAAVVVDDAVFITGLALCLGAIYLYQNRELIGSQMRAIASTVEAAALEAWRRGNLIKDGELIDLLATLRDVTGVLVDRAVRQNLFFATYTKRHPTRTRYKVYSGRTSGYGNPATDGQNIVNRRDRGHVALNGQGFQAATLDKASREYAAIRGREQMLIENYGGAQSTGGTSANKINGISSLNPARAYFINRALALFGRP